MTPAGSITPTGSLSALSTTYGTVSSETSFSFTASGLGASEVVTVTAPTGFEVSLTTSVGFGPSVTATANGGGNISATTIFVRLSATASVAGSPYSGNITLIGASASANEATVSSTVSAKALTMSGLTVPGSKIYDGTTSAAVSGSPALQASEAIGAGNSSDGKPYTGDVVSITGTAAGTYNSKDVATASTVTFSGLNLTGAQSSNYSLTIQAAAGATITTKALTVTGISVPASKIYDGTTTAAVSGSAALQAAEAAGAGSTADGKPYSGDVVGLTGTATGTYDSKDVSAATTVNYSGLSLTGAQLANYSLTQGSSAATITPKALTMSGLSVPASKIYDGTTGAVVSGGPGSLQTSEAVGAGTTADGIPYTGDAVSITGSAVGTYNSKDVATAATVTYSGLSLTGAQATNYSLTIQSSDPATITTKALTMTGLSVPASKIYDATTAAVVSGSPALQSTEAPGAGTTADGKPYSGDVVSITGSAVGTYDNKDVASATTVTYSGLSLTGAQNTNYTLTIQSAAAATITKKNLTITGVTANNKVYDGTTAATLSGAAALLSAEAAGAGTTADGKPYTGDAVTITGSGTGTFSTAATSAGQAGVSVNVTGYTFGGAQGGNYTPVQPTGLTANIDAAEPTGQAKTVSFGTVTAVSIPISWSAATSGGGTNYLVVMNAGGAGSIGSSVPADFTSYTASTDWLVPGGQVTPGNNFVVYNGTGTSVTVTNLDPNTTYEVQVFTFNGAAGSGLENYLTSVAGAGNPNNKKTSNVDNTATFSAGTGSATIASTVNTLGTEVMAFQFTATDLASGDGTSTRFTQLTFKAPAGNQISDWTQLIAGAELFDNAGHGGTYSGSGPRTGTHDPAVVATGPNTITIPTISAGGNGTSSFDLGTIGDGATRIYTLKIYLKSSLGGSLPTTVDNLHLEVSILGSDATPVAGKGTFAPATTTSSGSTNDKITVTASQLSFTTQPPAAASASVALSPEPILKATDVNGNLDLDPITATVSTPDAALSPTSAPTQFTLGIMDFTGSGFNYASTGNSRLTVTTTSPSLSVTSTTSTNVTASTNLGPSGLGMSSSPLFNSTIGVISGGVATNAVLGFNLVTTGSPLTLTQLVFNSSVSVTGLVQNFSLYSNSSDSFTGATLAATSSTLTFSGLSVPITGSATYFYLVCDVDASFPTFSPTISFSLPVANVTVSTGNKTGSTQTGITYTLDDITPPVVQSITVIPPPVTNVWSLTNGTSASTVTFRVTFSEPVSGIQYSGGNKNFQIQSQGPVSFSSIPSGAGSASNFVDVTVSGVSGQGLLRLDFVENDNISDVAGNPIGGAGFGNGNFVTTFTGNQFYSIVLPAPSNPVAGFVINAEDDIELQTKTTEDILGPQLPTHYLFMARESQGSTPFPTVTNGVLIPDDQYDLTYPPNGAFYGDYASGDGVFVFNTTVSPSVLNYTWLFKAGMLYDFIVYPYTKSPNYSDDNVAYGTPTSITNHLIGPVATNSFLTSTPAPAPIASTFNSPGNMKQVFTFNVTDGLGNVTGIEFGPTKFSGLTITEDPALDNVPNWSTIIAGAELFDINSPSTFVSASSILSNQIQFNGIPASLPADLGYVSPSNGWTGFTGTKTYGLRIYLNNGSGALTDNQILAFKVTDASFTYNNGLGTTVDHQQSDKVQTGAAATSGANTIDVQATKLVYTTQPQTQIGVASLFPAAGRPVINALDAQDNLDLNYSNSANITNTAGLGQNIASQNFSAGVLTLNTFKFTTAGGPTQIVITGTGLPAVGFVNSTASVTTVISNKTTITAGTLPASELASFPSTTNSLPVAFNFDFVVADDVGADGVNLTDNDGLPTIIQTITITQDPNNGINAGGDVATFDDWTKTIAGAQLTDVNTSTSVNAASINGSSLVFNLPVGMQTVPDGLSQTYQLRIWLKNPVDPTLVDILDNKDFAFAINETNLSPLGAANTTSTMTASSTNTGDGRNVVTVTASQLDFVTQWLPGANQSYDAPLDADAVTGGVQSPAGKARDANGNLDLDFNAVVTVATQSPVLLPLANAAVGVSNGLLSFNPGLQVTSLGGGANGTTTNLVLTSGVLAGSSNNFKLNYSGASDIVRDNAFSYPTNILYASANNQVTDIGAGTGIAMEQFTLRDGGGLNDADGSPTQLTAITFNVTNWQNLRRLALYNGATEIQELDASAFLPAATGDITFNSFVTPFSATDNNTSNLTIKASFNGNGVIDNQVVTFRIVSVAASAVSSSQFLTTSPVGIQSSVSSNENKIEVVATQLDITTPAAAANASISTDFPGGGTSIIVEARDMFANRDLDFNGKITAIGNQTVATMINGPITSGGSQSAFGSGLFTFNTNFQFTTGANGDLVTINTLKADNTGGNSGTDCTVGSGDAICIGITPTITLKTSFESSLQLDPTFKPTLTPLPRVQYISYLDSATFGTSTNGYELVRAMVVDGSKTNYTYTNQFSQSGILDTQPSDAEGNGNGDSDGATSNLTNLSLRVYGAAALSRIALFDSTGTLIPSTLINVTSLGLSRSPVAGVDTTSYVFTWNSASPLVTAKDNGQAPFSVRVSFRKTSSHIRDTDPLEIKLLDAQFGTGSQFYQKNVPGYIAGGIYHLPYTPQQVGQIDVAATSLDFTTQASPFAGINEPVGPTYTTSPLPSTSAAIVQARDRYTLLDLEFNYPPASIAISDIAGDNIPAPSGFVNGVLNLDGMEYATPGDGTLKVVANGLDSSNPPVANTSAISGALVNVINVSATYNGVGVLGNGVPAPLSAPVSIKGGSLAQNIFGVTFTASGTTATEPKLQKFSISFDSPFSTSTRTIFSNFVVREGSSDVTGFGGNLTLASSKGNSNLDSIIVDLSASPRAFDPTTHQLTYYLIADVDATANISTPPITPQFKDGGYLSLSDKNIVVTEGTGSGTFDGNVYSFASTKPPVLITAKNTLHPNQTSDPYNGQLNVSALLDSIHLRFDTKVTSLDGVAELWNRSSNTKVADLIARINPGNVPTVNGNFLSTGNVTTVDNPLRYKISFLPGQSFQADEVYYVTIKKGDFDPLAQPPSGHGISDEGLNFYGGITSNSTLYFKISSNQPIVLSQPAGKIYNPSVASLSTVFDQFGTAYYLVLPVGSPAPSSLTEVKTPSTYPTQSLIVASGNYAIDQINTVQTVTFPAANPSLNPFVASQNYDVYIYAENDANPIPISSGGIYGSLANGFAPGTSGPTLQIKAPAAPVANQPFYLICPGSFVTVSDPILLGETAASQFSAGTILSPTLQDFNIVLPSGYEFDGVTLPDVQLIGADFNGTVAGRSFISNSVLKISYRNFGSSSMDYIAISNLRVIGTQGSASQPILRFFGNNTSFASPTATVGTIGLFPSKTYNFDNSYSSDPNNIFPPGSPTFVDAIPDNYVDADPNIKGSVRLLPLINVVTTHDYNASIFDGTGVTNDLLTLSAVPTDAAFNITMNHTDPNGCNTQVSQQYLVYDHTSPISKKLGTSNSVVNLPGTAQALFNTAFPGPSPLLISSQTILDNELAGYELKSLSADIPASVIKGQASQIMSGPDWQAQIQKIPSVAGSVTNVFGTFFSYKWDYSHILNALTEPGANPGGSIKVDPYYGDLNTPFDAKTALGNKYWKGGSLGKVQFTGLFQSTADLSVYIPFRQDVELFVPAVPLVEVASSNQSSYDPADATVNTNTQTAYTYINNTYGFQYTNANGYQGTSVFCEQGGPITLNGYPAALAGTSTGTFAIYDFQSYDFGGLKTGTITSQTSSATITGTGTLFTTQLKVGSILSDASGNFIGTVQSITDNLHLTLTAPAAITIPVANAYQAIFNTPLVAPAAASAFVDNGNGSMTLDPSSIKNNYNDILVAYTYQENNSPAAGTGYIVIRVTPNPVAQFTIASTAANPGASAFDKFCLGSLITFDGSVSTIGASSQGSINSINNYTWDFGDPNSGLPNSPATPNANPALPPSPGGAGGQIISSAYVQANTPASQTYDQPVHIYTTSSTYPVNLTLTSNWGCVSLPVAVPVGGTVTQAPNNVKYPGSSGTIKVGDIPVPIFSVVKNCVGDLITFDASLSSVSGNSTISTYNWNYNFQIPANGLPDPSPATASLASATGASTTYSKSGFYNVLLTPITTLGCQKSDTSVVSQLDVVSAFNNNFDSNNGGWQTINLASNSPGPGDPQVSWSWTNTSGRTNGVFDSPSGNKMWVTSAIPDATTGYYNPNEKSALYSACLNLDPAIVPRPMISFSSFVDVSTGDGLVLQYSIDDLNILDPKKVWNNLGGIGSGLDWYTNVGLPSNPGSNNSAGIGWSGNGKKWIHPKHALDILSSPTQKVILRFALSSVASSTIISNTTTPYDGVSVDSVFFGSRTRTILFENFTTTDDGNQGQSPLNADLKSEADSITAFVQRTISKTQLVNINYHVGFIGVDPFNLDNPADPSSRALYYNVKKVPYAFLDGIHYRDSTKVPPSDLFQFWGQTEYDLNTLQLAKADFSDPSPNTKLTTVSNSNPDGSLQVDVNFTPVFDLPYGVRGGTVLQVAILEKVISPAPSNGKVTTGETTFNYVLKKMLPNAAGTKFTNPILATVPVSAGTFKWIPENLHSNTLTVVVFLQNEDTKEVYQAFIYDDVAAPTPVTEIQPITADRIRVYPNPSDQEFTVELPVPAQQSMKLTMANQLGQFTEVGAIGEGEQSKKISTQGLAEGVYILQLGSNGNALRTKIVVLHK